MIKLEIPCSYQGGKQRLANDIVDIILQDNPCLLDDNDTTHFYDLCCGSGSISIELLNRGVSPYKIIMLDASPWGLFWQTIGNGTFNLEIFQNHIDAIPKDITQIKDFVKQIIQSPAKDALNDNIAYKFLILQACAFGATATWVEDNQWKKAGGLRDYWLPTATSNRKSPVNPMMPMPDTLFKRVKYISSSMKGVKGHYTDINSIEVLSDSIVYIDPPYDKTCKYGYNFNYIEFIDKIKNKNKIYLSEGKPLSDNTVCLSKGRTKGGINGNKNKKANEEWLNIYK